jgi:hypothetical protein
MQRLERWELEKARVRNMVKPGWPVRLQENVQIESPSPGALIADQALFPNTFGACNPDYPSLGVTKRVTQQAP